MALLKALGVSQSALRIDIAENCFFLRPSPDPEHIPSDDVLIHGSLVLNLSKPKKFKDLVVRVTAHYTIAFPDDGYEQAESILAEVHLQDSSSTPERLYDKGEHVFAFSLVVPASSAVFERCRYGKVVHTIDAVAEGAGRVASNNTASRPIYLVGNPAPLDETSGLNVRVEAFEPELGPYAVHTAAQHLTVGGLLHFDFILASVPHQTSILSVSAVLVAKYEIHSVKKPEKKAQFAEKRMSLFLFDAAHPPNTDAEVVIGAPAVKGNEAGCGCCSHEGARHSGGSGETRGIGSSNETSLTSEHPGIVASPTTSVPSTPDPTTGPNQITPPLSVVPKGGSYHVKHLARLPNDDILRPSTIPGSNTPLIMKHELIFEVRFSTSDPSSSSPSKPRVLRSGHPVMLSSCCCMLSMLLVPTYSEVMSCSGDELWKDAESSWDKKNAECICQESRDDLIAQYSKLDRVFLNGTASGVNGGGGNMATVVSWDGLEGVKFEYEPVARERSNA